MIYIEKSFSQNLLHKIRVDTGGIKKEVSKVIGIVGIVLESLAFVRYFPTVKEKKEKRSKPIVQLCPLRSGGINKI